VHDIAIKYEPMMIYVFVKPCKCQWYNELEVL